MKKWIIVAALATAILASCTKNEVRVDAPDQAISFTTAVGANSTKAMMNDATYDTDVSFGTQAWYVAGTGTFPTGADVYIPHTEVSYQTSAWTTATPYYWPSAGSLTFISYSPYTELKDTVKFDTTAGITIENWDVLEGTSEANQAVDVMVADIISGQTANSADGVNGNQSSYNGVPTVFRHKLSQIVGFNFKTDADYANGHDGNIGTEFAVGDKRFFLTGIQINDVHSKGTYKSGIPTISGTSPVQYTNGGSWTMSETTPARDYVWYSRSAGDAGDPDPSKGGVEFDNTTTTTNANGTAIPRRVDGNAPTYNYLLIMPQTFTDNSNYQVITLNYVIRTYTSSTDYTDDEVTKTIELYDLHSPTPMWDMNKKITYNFTISLANDRIYWAPSIETWSDESVSSNIN